jgi:hypothetical protein
MWRGEKIKTKTNYRFYVSFRAAGAVRREEGSLSGFLFLLEGALLPHPFRQFFRFENSASPLHMVRGEKAADNQGNKGVRLMFSQ